MQKIFINYNAKDNFGDDLFVRIMCENFSQAKFRTLIPKEFGKGIEKIKNLRITDLNPKTAGRAYAKAIAKADMCTYVGGQVFAEEAEDIEQYWEFRYMLRSKPLYYINASFGPYYTNNFLAISRDYVSECEGVWFRDNTSYELFNGKNIHYMPDLAYIASFPEPLKLPKPYVVVSMVDLSGRPELSVIHEKYIAKMRWIAESFKKKGFEVIVLASCRYEWDDKAAEELSDLGTVVTYNGDMDYILSIIKGAKCVVGSRFHAIVCALAAGVCAIPVCYSDNLKNAVLDFDKTHPCFDVKNLADITEEALDAATNYKTTGNINEQKVKIRRELSKLQEIFYKK